MFVGFPRSLDNAALAPVIYDMKLLPCFSQPATEAKAKGETCRINAKAKHIHTKVMSESAPKDRDTDSSQGYRLAAFVCFIAVSLPPPLSPAVGLCVYSDLLFYVIMLMMMMMI